MFDAIGVFLDNLNVKRNILWSNNVFFIFID